MWRDLIQGLSGECAFGEPAGEGAVDDIERRLGQEVPVSLRALLLESDGVKGTYGLDVVWSADRIASENETFRAHQPFAELYMSFDALMFFGDNGNGDQFAFIRTKSRGDDIFVWDHETDERILVAHSLEQYLTRCFDPATAGTDWYR
ncbi:SMI1/KNR4 family protein [Streptomyces sp. SBT349]|uniref:SMI1/KNR4 family protein n=1 Tax=Streptomyces sp. SBT349 TaxID=1580539 RepID=UPI00069E5C18|nr:SMI1/KNR4 family protein [Streptomyces sp. SBT349]